MNHFNQELIRIIKEKTPEGTNPVDLLYEVIPIKKESLYRRLRGEVSFTLEEVLQIAVKLQISLDELLSYKPKGIYKINMIKVDDENMISGYFTILEQLLTNLRYIGIQSNSMYYCANNTLPLSQTYTYPTLSKFRIFTHNYQFRKDTLPKKMSEIIISPEVRKMEEIYISELQHIPTTCIWTNNIFLPIVTEIQYFSEMGVLSKEDIISLKEEMYDLLSNLENNTSRGETSFGSPFFVYLSNNYFENNCLYIETPTFKSTSIKVFGFNIFSSTEVELCDNMKRWITSLIRYSVPISKSGIVERVQFFKRQREFIDSLDKLG